MEEGKNVRPSWMKGALWNRLEAERREREVSSLRKLEPTDGLTKPSQFELKGTVVYTSSGPAISHHNLPKGEGGWIQHDGSPTPPAGITEDTKWEFRMGDGEIHKPKDSPYTYFWEVITHYRILEGDRIANVDDGWIPWGGGENPVPGKMVYVKVKMTSFSTSAGMAKALKEYETILRQSEAFDSLPQSWWSHKNPNFRITAYKLAS